MRNLSNILSLNGLLCHVCGIIVLGMSLLVGCSDQEEVSKHDTMLSLSIEELGTDITTRALPAQLPKPLAEAFTLSLIPQEKGQSSYEGAFRSLLGPLYPGFYTIKVSHGQNKLALDAPYYIGTTQARVIAGWTNVVALQAGVGNALLSVSYTDVQAMKEAFSQYEVIVRQAGEQVSLSANNPEAHAYFPAQSDISVSFHATHRDGQEVWYDLTPKLASRLPLPAAHHLRLSLRLSGDAIDIQKAEVEQVSIQETLPAQWLPRPHTVARGFDAVRELHTIETAPLSQAVVSYVCAQETQEIELVLQLEDKDYAEINGTYRLSEMTLEERRRLSEAGIRLPGLGTTHDSLDFTSLAASLRTNEGVPTRNLIGLRIKSSERWDSETPVQYCISVDKPKISLNIKPEDVWSKSFSLEPALIQGGDESRLRTALRYEYSADGKTWLPLSDGLEHHFKTHPRHRDYFVRAFYRPGIASQVVSLHLEEPAQLPNSDMEQWHYSNVALSINTYRPWASDASSFWETNNSFTTRYVSTFNWFNAGSNPYNCFPAVSYVPDAHSGVRAAEIRSTASGRGNTLPSNVLGLNKVAGELFTASLSVSMGGTAAVPSGDTYVIDAKGGRPFTSRPTALRFWYKYQPEGSDTWRVRLVLMDDRHEPIISREVVLGDRVNQWRAYTLPLDYVAGESYAKCSYIYLCFSSTTQAGDNMPYRQYPGYALWEDGKQVMKDNTRCWIGSILSIDDISLVYEK